MSSSLSYFSSRKLIFTIFFIFLLACNNFAIAETVEISHISNRVSIAEPPWNDYNPSSLNRVGVVVTDPEVYWSTSHFQFVAWLPKTNFDNADTVAPFSAKDCEVRYEKSDGVIVGHADVSITTTTNYCTVIVDFKGMDLSAYSSKTLLWVEGLEDSQLDPKYYTSSLNWSPENENCFLECCNYYNPETDQPVPAFDQSGDVEGYHYVSYPSEFYHTLQYNYNQSYQYNQLDIIKNDTYGVFSSNCTVSILDSDNNLIQEMTNQTEAGWDSENISLKLFDSYIEYIDGELLEVKIDPFAFPGFIFTEYFTFTPLPPADDGIPNTLSGTVLNAKNNVLLDNVTITATTTTGYGDNYSTSSEDGFYELKNITDDNYYIEATLNGYETYTQSLTITEDLTLNIYMVKNITVDSGKAGIYGVVTNYYNNSAIPDVYIKLENDTLDYADYTNLNGYYEILDFDPGTYTLTAIKEGYYPQEYNLTFSPDELQYYPFMMISEEIPTDAPDAPEANATTSDAVIGLFGLAGFPSGWIRPIFALIIIIACGVILGYYSKNMNLASLGMFFGFIVTIALELLPKYFLAIVIIMTVLYILESRVIGGG
ncbi:MAG: carboxypeptidase regulatory-like domain-containing protein [Halobacteriota archaeon]|nr:carboxypeptidase regulatory-like domain-containing protein [Halobacteriota archaeon]